MNDFAVAFADPCIEGSVISENDDAGTFREVVVLAVGTGVAAVGEKHSFVVDDIVIIVVVAAEGGDETGFFHRVEHARVVLAAADRLSESPEKPGGVRVFGEGNMEECDGWLIRVFTGGFTHPLDLLIREPGVAEVGVIDRIGGVGVGV